MTFSELKAALVSWLNMDADSLPDAVCGQIVNMAIQEYSRKLDLRFNELTTIVMASAGVYYADLPDSYSRPQTMYYIEVDGTVVYVDYITREEYLIKYPNTVLTGAVKHYTVWNNQIMFGPTPQEDLMISFDIYEIVPDLVSPTATNGFTLHAWPLILMRSCCLASLFGVEDSRIPTWEAQCVKLENQLVIEHARAKSVGRRPVSRDYGYTGKEA